MDKARKGLFCVMSKVDHRSHISAEPGDLYWRYEVCKHRGAKVLLLTIGGVCIVGSWYGDYGKSFVAWCPLPKRSKPRAIDNAPLIDRIKFAFRLIFKPQRTIP